MKKRIVLWAAVLFVLALVGVGAWGWLAAPRLLEVSPLAGSRDVPVGAPLRLSFSRPLDPESLQEHLHIEPARAGTYSWEAEALTFTPDLRWPGGISITVTLDAGARAAAWPGWPLWRGQSWSFSTSQTLMAYLWPAGEPADLYALDLLSGEVIRWTEVGGVLDFSASADGTLIYLSIQNPRGGSDLYRLDRLAAASEPETALELLLACPDALCRLPQPDPLGRWLAYERAPLADEEPGTQVWLLPLDGGEARPAGSLSHRTSQPQWAQNGWLAFYDRDQAGYVLLDPAAGDTRLAPNQTGEAASWQPDGRAFVAAEILFEAVNLLQDSASSHLLRFDLADSPAGSLQPADLTQDVAIEDAEPAYSPDGAWLAFARKYLDLTRWSPGRQLWVMAADGSQVQQLTVEPLYNHYSFAWSTDARRIAYVRFHQTALVQPPELWVVNLDGSDPVQLVIGGYAPLWIP